MNRFERHAMPESTVEIRETENGREVIGRSYRLLLEQSNPDYKDCLKLSDESGNDWVQLYQGSRLTTSDNKDVTLGYEPPVYEKSQEDGSVVIRIESVTGTEAKKTQVFVCRDDFIETYITADISGSLEEMTWFGGTHVAPNMFGTSMSERYFTSVHNPQPSEMERMATSALESTVIATDGRWRPGRRREFLNTPFAYGFNMSSPGENGTLPEGDWLMASLSAPIEEQSMVDFAYDAREDGFMLKTTYDSTESGKRKFTSPSLLLHFAPNPTEGMTQAKKLSVRLGHLEEVPVPRIEPWHLGTEFISWGQQKEKQYELEQLGVSARASDFATEAFITEQLALMEYYGVAIDVVGIDDKWQELYGLNLPDTKKWPNMPRFTDTQHELGRNVILWWKLFDPEGLPEELCILGPDGRPVASDPTNPDYLAVASEQTRHMLGRSALNADGLKLDFIAQLPNGPGLRWHGNERGPAALHKFMKVIYQAAKDTKKDSLVEAQVINPWFADVMDQVRLNDTNEKRGSAVLTMGRRAILALTLMPNHSVDPDGWPMLDKESWLEYMKWQARMKRQFPDRFSLTTHYSKSVGGRILNARDHSPLHRISETV